MKVNINTLYLVFVRENRNGGRARNEEIVRQCEEVDLTSVSREDKPTLIISLYLALDLFPIQIFQLKPSKQKGIGVGGGTETFHLKWVLWME